MLLSHLSNSCNESASTRGAKMVDELGIAVAVLVTCWWMNDMISAGVWVFLALGVVRVKPEKDRALVATVVPLMLWLMLLPTVLSVSSAGVGMWAGVERRNDETVGGCIALPGVAVPSATLAAAFGRGRQDDDDGAAAAAAAAASPPATAAVVSSFANTVVPELLSPPVPLTVVGVMFTRNNGLSHRFFALGCS